MCCKNCVARYLTVQSVPSCDIVLSTNCMMDDYVGLVGLPVKQCEGEEVMPGGSLVTTVVNNNKNNNTKFARCEGCGEPIFDR